MKRIILPKHPATGIPYESMSNFKRFWKGRHPERLGNEDAMNEHELICGLSGSGKSSYTIQRILHDFLVKKTAS